jgi:hypothetical protein
MKSFNDLETIHQARLVGDGKSFIILAGIEVLASEDSDMAANRI